MDIYIDGSSFGNPGEAGIGAVLAEGEHTLKNISRYIGRQTNNVAEYTALVFALQEAQAMKITSVNLYTDSELLARQVQGLYKVRNGNLKNLFAQAEHLIGGFQRFSIRHIPREQNRGADKLARLAIKNRFSKTDQAAARQRPTRPGGKSEL